MPNSLWPHGLQHTRPPCPSPTPGVYSNLCPLSRWCHPTILSAVVPFSSCLQSFPAWESFPMSQLFTSGGQSIGVSASTSVLPMNIQDWFPFGWIGWISLQSKGLSRVFSNTAVQKHQFFSTWLEEAQAGIKIAERNINDLRYADDTILRAEREELKSLLMKVKGESEKVGLKLNIQKMKIMAYSPITSWQIDGETVETVADFILGGSKITADGNCSHEIKRRLLLGRKVMTNLDSILKSRNITLSTKVRLVKATVFPLVMYGCESWTIKKAEPKRIDVVK